MDKRIAAGIADKLHALGWQTDLSITTPGRWCVAFRHKKNAPWRYAYTWADWEAVQRRYVLLPANTGRRAAR